MKKIVFLGDSITDSGRNYNDIDSVDKLLNIKSIIDQLYEEYIELNKLAYR